MARYGLALRRAALAAAATLTVAVPAADAATVDNPGNLTARFEQGGLKLADDSIEIALSPTNAVTINGAVASTGFVHIPSGGLAFPDTSLPFGNDATLTVELLSHGGYGTLNPLTGVASLTLRVEGVVKLDDPVAMESVECHIGSAATPVELTVKTGTTSSATPITGVAYDPSTGAATLVDDTFSLLGGSCVGTPDGNPLHDLATDLLEASVFGAEHNEMTFSGVFTPKFVGSVPPPTPPTGGGDGGNNGGGSTPPPTPPPTTPSQGGSNGGGITNPPATQCVVPKLKGLTLTKAKAALKKANCKLGKVTKKASSKKKNTVIGFSPKAGSKAASGTKVALTLSKGPAKKKRR